MIDFSDIPALVAASQSGKLSPLDIVEEVIEGIELSNRPEAWLHIVDAEVLRARARSLVATGRKARGLPLFGVPFAVKDNIDAAWLPTTAGCPAYAYTPAADAHAVARLVAAGAILVGKTHMDQFATGLVGTRSPHGPCRNAHVADRISGGSSSGSAVVVAQGLVSFALGTDTAGSGRVPAVLNGIVGLKPTRGRVSSRGVVPACASLDCVSVFAHSSRDAACVLGVLDHFDEQDPFARRPGAGAEPRERFRFGVPSCSGAGGALGLDAEASALFARAVALLEKAGGCAVEIDYAPFREAAELLYGGAWVAERQAAVGDFLASHPAAVDPAVAAVIHSAEHLSARQAFEGLYRLRALETRLRPLWQDIDLLVVPTAARAFRIDEVLARPMEASELFGATNNFMNLLDMAGVAVPTGAFGCGVPFGVTLAAPAFSERMLLDIGTRLETAAAGFVPGLRRPERVRLAVVGAHLRGMPLHGQLTALDARLVAETRTSADYRLYALTATVPAKPGLKRVASDGASIEVEVYSLSAEAFGRFVAAVPRPLAIGRLTLEDGSEVSGFVCEPEGLEGAQDISSYGGWRGYQAVSRPEGSAPGSNSNAASTAAPPPCR